MGAGSAVPVVLVVMARYLIGTSGQQLLFTPKVLAHFRRHQQRRFFEREAGGQLFATIANNEITIVEATGPRRTDLRSRRSYIPDRNEEQREIIDRHRLGLHFVGDWHTHPEHSGSPSSTDLSSISEMVRKSRHNLNGFVLVVVGYNTLPGCMHVSVHDGSHEFELQLLDSTPSHENGQRLTSSRSTF
jgi:integrative and conjugative element protein (TIGR02256 family)